MADKGTKPIFSLLIFRAAVVITVAALFFTGLPDRISYPKLHWETAKQYAGAWGMDPYLVMALMKVESNFKSGAKSASGAVGLMQVMPETGKWVAEALGTGDFYDNMLLDVDFNIMVGSWYIDHLMEKYKAPAAAIAAYNAGMGNVDTWIAEGIWTGNEGELSGIPFKETREFVAKVMRVWDKYAAIYGAVE